ncbi:tripartite tricarboxylate transporter substrate binding protein [Niallia endozanthoxylica]|uniref:Tripartite tricarboxylate transporter substrate binding protein n=1 Tax=Niallia endozanthoxylica TaxID=2036016 RepID=A0A5J5I9N3_9BACI|nr:tripartite tricarboxylate transporter substrate binding protein [Niallia endozanthoxylica]KAA9031663.1 tripartite tricarboxylate transporter substrate binding protein [Niallia endozanthoxylica]
MKKFVMLFLSVLLIVLAGCSNSSQPTESKAANDEKQSKIDYPTRPIEVLVPFAAGGSTDIGARIIEKYLPKYLPGAQLVIVNKPGGSGSIAITDLFNSKPDGYTLAMSTHRAISMQPLYGNVKYTHESFQPIAKVFGNQQIMIVKADAPWETFEEWLDYVKKNPGKFSYGVAGGLGSGAHIPVAELEKQAGFEAKAVSFEGTPPAITAVLGGHVQGAMVQPSDAKSLIESGELRGLFNVASVPVPYFPDIPLLKDKGFDVAIDSNTSLFAPKGVPQETVTMLEEALKKTMEDPEVLAEFEKVSLQTNYGGPEIVQKEVNEENVRFGKMLKELGLIK